MKPSHICPDCGGRKSSSAHARCRDCRWAHQRANSTCGKCALCGNRCSYQALTCLSCWREVGAHRPRYWTRERCLEALHLWVAKHGRLPRASTDWAKAAPEHPTSNCIIRRFGYWNVFLREGGYTPPRPGFKPRWTKERIIEALLDDVARRGRWPHDSEWLYADPDGRWPATLTVRKKFGSWLRAHEAAGRTISPALRRRMHVNSTSHASRAYRARMERTYVLQGERAA